MTARTDETGSAVTLAEAAKPLYALPLDEFTAARNAKAKSEHDTQLSKQLRKLPKPSVSAWAVNMLVQHRGEQIDEALALGELLRQAQDNLDRNELVTLLEQRKQLIAALAREAREVAGARGNRISDAAMREVEQTLQAAMTDADAAAALRAGRLVRPLAATGLDPVDLTDAVAAPDELPPGRAESRKRAKPKGPSKKQLADARRALEEAEQAESDAQSQRDDLKERAEQLEARRKKLAAELKKLQARLADVESELAFAEREGRALGRDRENAAEEVEQAGRRAKRALDRLERLRNS